MNKKLTYAGISALLLLVISGCGEKPTAAPADAAGTDSNAVVSGAGGSNADNSNSGGNNNSSTNGSNNSNDSGSNTPAVTQAPAATEAPASTDKPVSPDKQSQSIAVYYTDPQQMELVTGKATIEFSEEAEKYSEAFKALQNSENSDMVPLWGDIELKSLKFTDGQVLIDIHKPVEAQLGAGGEAMAISALTQTFFQFEAVKSVELLVDGEQVESLMGHVDLEHPMTRENSGL